MKPYVSIPRAAEMLGLERKAFLKVAQRERFEMITPNEQRRVLVADVLKFLHRIRQEEIYPTIAAANDKYAVNELAD